MASPNIQRIKQVAIILFTITAVLTTAYFFRTPRGQVESVCENCKKDLLNEKTSPSLFDTAMFLTDSSEIMPSEVPMTTDELRMEFLEIPYNIDKFTIVTPTFKRTSNLYKLFDEYCKYTDIVDKIIVLWNNVGTPVPTELIDKAKDCTILVVIKIMEHNNLTSRFILFSEIETAAILSIDDDLLLPDNSLHLTFETWKKYPYLLIGYTPRIHVGSKGNYRYSMLPAKRTYSMVMTNVAMIHRFYLNMFSTTVPQEVVDYIVSTTNGEDITMNVLVAKYLSEQFKQSEYCACVEMTCAKKEIGNLSSSGYNGLWHRKDHKQQRTDILNLLDKVYGSLYLGNCHKSVSKLADI